VGGIDVVYRIADSFGGSPLSPDTVATDFNGFAVVDLLLPERIGEYIIIASTARLTGQNVAFHCQVNADNAYRLAKFANDYQSMTAGRELIYPPTVQVTDQYGNYVKGETITFVLPSGDGSVLTPKVVTDDSGRAACHWILSSVPKTNLLAAYRLGLHNSPVQFTAIGVLNRFPEFINLPPANLKIEYNKDWSFQLQAQDGDHDLLRYYLSMTPKVVNATFDSLVTHIFSWKPTVRQKGNYRINLRVEDSRGGFDIDSLLVSVVGDSAPVFTSIYPLDLLVPITMPGSQLFTCAATDFDNDVILFTWYVNGSPKTTGARFVLNSLEYPKGTLKVKVEASDGVKSAWSPEWEIILESVELNSFTATAEPYRGVLLDWRTGNENGNAGFDLLRAHSADGPFHSITGGLIPSREDHLYQFIDSTAVAGERYYYVLEDINRSGLRNRHEPVMADVRLPDRFDLMQNFPNPFNPETSIRFQIARATPVRLVLFNTLGQQVRVLADKKLDAGYYELKWDGRDDTGQRVGSGIYYYRLESSEFKSIKKMLLLR